MRNISFISSLTLLLVAVCGTAQGQDPRAAIQQKLVSEYALTQPTADNTDIVTAGAVLVLKKGDIMMTPVSNPNPYQNTYKDGQISQNSLGKFEGFVHKMPGQSASTDRTFVPGEKMWVTKIEVKADGIFFTLFTDAISDIRYKATLKFWFPKGSIPSVEQADKLVAQVFGVQAEDANAQQGAAAPAQGGPANSAQTVPVSPAKAAPAAAAQPAPAAPPAEAAPPPPIAPPPPPTDQAPATIKPGASPDQVVASLGEPQKQIRLGAKLIYVYKDIKVTFVNNKVTDVQ